MSTLKSEVLLQPQDLYTSSATQGTDLGAKATTGDGRIFRYVLAGVSSLDAGTLIQSPAQDATNLNPSGGLFVLAASASLAVGSTSISLGLSASTYPSITAAQAANLVGGFVSIAVTPGPGQTYKIKSVSASTTGATAAVITLEDPIRVLLTTSSRATLVQNSYRSVIVAPASTATGCPVGIAVYPITLAQYGWVQTRGLVSCLTTGNSAIGTALMPSSGTAGGLITQTAGYPIVANVINTCVSGEYDMVFATIE